MIKKIFLAIILLAVIAGSAVYLYRNQIIEGTAEKFIRAILPEYIKIEKIDLSMSAKKLVLGKFAIMNPPGFSTPHLVEIDEVSCSFRMNGVSLMSGIEILSPILTGVVLNIERAADGSTNLEAMAKHMPAVPAKKAPEGGAAPEGGSNAQNKKSLSDTVKIPETFIVKTSKIVFTDSLPFSTPYAVTLDKIDATLTLKLDSTYTKVLRVGTAGTGCLNGYADQTINWNIILDPTTPKLTMSNNIEISNADIMPFAPYYDKISPFVFKEGRFSGSFVIDFDNGNIGSTNVVKLKNYVFFIKRGQENSAFWETSVQDLAKYFTSSFDGIVFDFKIKGDMAKPDYFLGPISRQAVTSMTIDKVSSMIGQAASEGSKEDKTQEYIDLFKELIKKK
ncbi:MAG: hypothetical protein WC779_06470 [Candidatus Omnitrophota bacterium]|jgi:hypothetical protein